MKLIIDRATWLRGEGYEDSKLYRPSDGKMCCLGFYSLACGLQQNDITELECPGSATDPKINKKWPKWLTKLENSQTKECIDLMEHNDNENISDKERENKIKTIFARHGVKVEFK